MEMHSPRKEGSDTLDMRMSPSEYQPEYRPLLPVKNTSERPNICFGNIKGQRERNVHSQHATTDGLEVSSGRKSLKIQDLGTKEPSMLARNEQHFFLYLRPRITFVWGLLAAYRFTFEQFTMFRHQSFAGSIRKFKQPAHRLQFQKHLLFPLL